jgi:hypothetical protein
MNPLLALSNRCRTAGVFRDRPYRRALTTQESRPGSEGGPRFDVRGPFPDHGSRQQLGSLLLGLRLVCHGLFAVCCDLCMANGQSLPVEAARNAGTCLDFFCLPGCDGRSQLEIFLLTPNQFLDTDFDLRRTRRVETKRSVALPFLLLFQFLKFWSSAGGHDELRPLCIMSRNLLAACQVTIVGATQCAQR